MRFEDLRILLIDANGKVRSQTGSMLRQVGIRFLDETDDGLAGIDLLRGRSPDLLMVGDVPDSGDGIALTRMVRDEISATLPIILIAGYADLWRLDQARQAGATEFLVRPFTVRALLLRLQRAAASCRKGALRAV